jgi:nucleotidyltransferase/DNA polymerase involved in DNA repair
MADKDQTTTKKHRKFVNEPLGEKPVEDIPGIGEAHGKKLREQGFDKAYKVLGQFLLQGKNKEAFVDWLRETAKVTERDAIGLQSYNAIKEWTDGHV